MPPYATPYGQAELLLRYRAVLFAEVDEIVIPREGSLRDSVAAFARGTEGGGAEAAAAGAAAAAEAKAQVALPPAVACTGWEMHHDFGTEPAIDLSRPLLAQRSRWHRNTLYDKARYGYTYYGYTYYVARKHAVRQGAAVVVRCQ